jgi:hypothetical protein
MEILVIIALVILAGLMIFMANRKPEGSSSTIMPILDANKDGKVDLNDAVFLGDIAAKKTKAAATKATTAVKKTATKAKTAVKKVAAKKAPAKKPAAKKTTKK